MNMNLCKFCGAIAIWSFRSGLIRTCNKCRSLAQNELATRS